MARLYSALAVVGNQTTANTDDVQIEVNIPANVTIRVRRIRIEDNSGQGAALADLPMRVKLLQTSTTMADGSAFTPVKLDPRVPASACTCKVKTASTSVATPGTITRTFDQLSLRSEHEFELFARDNWDAITINGAAFFAIVLSTSSITARTRTIYLVWEEF